MDPKQDHHHDSHETPRPVDDPRVYLAAERTYLAWVRTSLGLIGFGFLIARFALLLPTGGEVAPRGLGRPLLAPYLGFTIVCLGAAACVIAAIRHRSYVHALRAGVANPPLSLVPTMALAAVLTVAGLTMAIHILML